MALSLKVLKIPRSQSVVPLTINPMHRDCQYQGHHQALHIINDHLHVDFVLDSVACPLVLCG